MKKSSLAVAVAAAFFLSTVSVKPARADGGAITLAIIAAVLTIATIKCADADKRDRLCISDWFAPPATAYEVKVRPTPPAKKEASASHAKRYAKTHGSKTLVQQSALQQKQAEAAQAQAYDWIAMIY